MSNNIRKSRYCFLIKDKDDILAYTSAKNGFHVITPYIYDIISTINTPLSEIGKQYDEEEINTLHKLGLITTEQEDDSIIDRLRFRFLISAYATSVLNLTIHPTLQCNLECPYCFEKNKPLKKMDQQTCDKLIGFIENHKEAKTINITWFGGEPLMGTGVIQYLLDKIDTLEDKKLGYQSIITNGTLLNSKTLETFKKHPLNQIQITFDGKKHTHDTKRIRHDGTGTYDTIISNLDDFIHACPDTKVDIRVNIDKNNADEFMDIYEELKQRYPEKQNLTIYPGILKACGNLSNGAFLTNKDLLDINESFCQKGYPLQIPFTHCSGCTATALSSYVIGPKGEIYKCWEDVGIEEKVIGYVDGKTGKAPHLLTSYMMRGSHILDNACEECPLLPVCSNDCAHDRLFARENGMKDEELCTFYKTGNYEGLNHILLKFFHTQHRLTHQ